MQNRTDNNTGIPKRQKTAAMSRWLHSVGNFLEQLDDTAAEQIQQQLKAGDEEDVDVDLTHVLAARGLQEDVDDDDVGDEWADDDDVEFSEVQAEETERKVTVAESNTMEVFEEAQEEENKAEDNDVTPSKDEAVSEVIKDTPNKQLVAEVAASLEATPPPTTQDPEPVNDPDVEGPTKQPRVQTPKIKPPATPFFTPKLDTTASDATPAVVEQVSTQSAPPPPAVAGADAKIRKEARQLRKHVVTLHQQLEAAESELTAQRVELEKAAKRIEQDRTKHTTALQQTSERAATELRQVRHEHQQAIKDAKEKAATQLQQVQQELQDLQQRFHQQDGHRTRDVELAQSAQQESHAQLQAARDENQVLLMQISTLQNQQEALSQRVASLSASADNSTDRERQAEERLDQALERHATVMQQRNEREQHLEAKIAELTTALVVQAPRQEPGLVTAQTEIVAAPEVLVLQSQLESSRQQCSALQQELQSATNERHETVTAQAKERMQYEERVADLQHQVRQLEQSAVAATPLQPVNSTKDDTPQIQLLSQEVLKQRQSNMHLKSEIAALTSRLSQAAQKQAAETPVAATSLPVRRRRPVGSMRTTLGLTTTTEYGDCVDAVDASLLKSGTMLRHNPSARIVLVFYLVVLHLWTLGLLVFHAHGGFDSFYQIQEMHHGPHVAAAGLPTTVVVATDRMVQVDGNVVPVPDDKDTMDAVMEKAADTDEAPKKKRLPKQKRKPKKENTKLA